MLPSNDGISRVRFPCRNFIRLVVGYALTCKMPLPAISDTIEEARYQARKNGRTHIAAVDLRNALLDFRIPSDAALQRAFESPGKRRNASPSRLDAPAGATHLQQHCNGAANVFPIVRTVRAVLGSRAGETNAPLKNY